MNTRFLALGFYCVSIFFGHGTIWAAGHGDGGGACDTDANAWKRAHVALEAGDLDPLSEIARELRPTGCRLDASNHSLVKVFQTLLWRAGYDSGPVDGIFGPITRGAVSRLQEDHGLPVNGKLTGEAYRVLADVSGVAQRPPPEEGWGLSRFDRENFLKSLTKRSGNLTGIGLVVGRAGARDSGDDFNMVEIHTHYGLPWRWARPAGLTLDTDLTATLGILDGDGDTGALVSLGPALRLSHPSVPVDMEIGLRAALISESEFADKDFGGPVQFVNHFAFLVDASHDYQLGLRFQHFSNNNFYSENNGLDLLMLELRRNLTD